MADAINYEQLDLFYLGREVDPHTGEATRRPLLIKSKQLTTHAAIIGMTGSGKTGLGIALLEEAAMDRLPAIVIDPKGDMVNLLLTFPDLAPTDFRPWIDPAAAEQKGLSVDEMAGRTADQWRQGLADWDQDGERIRRMRASAEFAVYTPGSAAVRPVSIFDSLEAPSAEVLADTETLADMIGSTVASLLGLLGIDADPLKSREHVLLSTILHDAWQQGQSLSLETLITRVAQPPFKQVGVFPVDAFYPPAKRMELALQLNTLIASPAFGGWTQGEPLAIEELLYTPAGKPRIAIFTIAHLSDSERMFFVTLLLGRLLGWMRRQEGSSGLRCLLYMDEIFGFFPPSANPPSKKPMLLLLKQARAFGLGVVLSTQNPVDLDYKGLANIGTWFVGRLQTRQDQDRVITGIAGSSKRFDEQELRRMIAGLRERSFLLSSAHRDEPTLFTTRWVLSYLKGPISLEEVGRLERGPGAPAGGEATPPPAGGDEETYTEVRPHLADTLLQRFVPPPLPGEAIRYRPALVGLASVRTVDQRRGIDETAEVCLRLPLPLDPAGADWSRAEATGFAVADLAAEPPAGALFARLPADLTVRRDFRDEEKRLSDHLYRSHTLQLLRVREHGLESQPGESEAAFHQRLAALLAAKKEEALARLEEQYGKKQRQLETQLEKALSRVGKEQGEVRARGVETALSVGAAILGAFLGRKPLSMTTATRSAQGVRSAGRLLKETGDVQRAREEAARIEAELARLGEELRQKLITESVQYAPAASAVETFAVTPRRADIFNVRVGLLWEPQYDFTPAAGAASA
jgi:hypothetical protein